MIPNLFKAIATLSVLGILGCGSAPTIPTVDRLDLKRFMGDWYVIASIPTVFEKEAFNAIESYRLDANGSVETTFRFNKGGFDGPEKVYTSRAFVIDTDSNAHWGMQFVWPFKAEYRVVFLAEDYSRTIIGRSKRDYVWIMARTPAIPDAEYARLLALLESYGYDIREVQKVPQLAAGISPTN
jgi:apolipoprotein D and lipocalin family protein